MEFRILKLPKSKAAELSVYSMESAEPYRPLPAPVYIFLPENEKIVPIKGSFDFFTVPDLERLRRGGRYFYGPIYRKVEPFLKVAREIKIILGWNASTATQVLEPAPYEMSDTVLRKLGGLWSPLGIPSAFAVAFANELCDAVPEGCLESRREIDPDRYELYLLRSGVFVFLALHLGYLDLHLLNEWRLRIFRETEGAPLSAELVELRSWVEHTLHSPEVLTLTLDQFEGSMTRVAQKLQSRLARVRSFTELQNRVEHKESEVGDVG